MTQLVPSSICFIDTRPQRILGVDSMKKLGTTQERRSSDTSTNDVDEIEFRTESEGEKEEDEDGSDIDKEEDEEGSDSEEESKIEEE